jgi:hypothetical protein
VRDARLGFRCPAPFRKARPGFQEPSGNDIVSRCLDRRFTGSALFLQRISPGIFGAHILITAMQGTSSLVEGHEDVYVNRAREIYGFLSANKPSQAKLARWTGRSGHPSATRHLGTRDLLPNSADPRPE